MIISTFRQGSAILREQMAQGHTASYVADADTAMLSASCSNASLRKHWRVRKKGSQTSTLLQEESPTNTLFCEGEGRITFLAK